MAAKFRETLRVFQKLDDLFQFFARFINPCDIFKRHTALPFCEELGLGFAKTHRAAAAAFLDLSQSEESDAEDQKKRQDLDEDDKQYVALLCLNPRIDHVLLFQQLRQFSVVRHRNSRESAVILQRTSNLVWRDLNFLNGTFRHFIAKIRIGNLRCRCLSGIAKHGHHQQQSHEHAAPYEQALHPWIRAFRAWFLRFVLLIHRVRFLVRRSNVSATP